MARDPFLRKYTAVGDLGAGRVVRLLPGERVERWAPGAPPFGVVVADARDGGEVLVRRGGRGHVRADGPLRAADPLGVGDDAGACALRAGRYPLGFALRNALHEELTPVELALGMAPV